MRVSALPRIASFAVRLFRSGCQLAGAWLRKSDVSLATILSGGRIIEVATREIRFGNYLHAQGDFRYLALVRNEDQPALEQLKRDNPQLAGYIVPCVTEEQITRNNANVLIFANPTVSMLALPRYYRRTDYLVWPLGVGSWLGTLGMLKSIATGTLKLLGTAQWQDDTGVQRKYMVARVLVERKVRARRYVSPVTGVENFYRNLEAQGVRYAILRWFDTLHDLPAGEDIDLIVADEDVDAMERAFGELPGLIPSDVYSASGLPGTEYANMAYYPPAIAQGILERSVLFGNGVRVPCPEDHFLSLAYHAV
ncbi:MAG: hypothetical protein ACE5Q6_16010, partial [Dehalococcoidia bacterium]